MVVIKAIQHQLTSDQIEELKKTFGVTDIIDIKNIVGKETYEKLVQTPGDEQEIRDLAFEFVEKIYQYANNVDQEVYLLLPIGSPAFMYLVAKMINDEKVRVLFAHSERITEETQNPDGTVTKKTVFKHVKFLVL